MESTRTPWRIDARKALLHPLWVGALAVLALNDHVMKDAMPGALTGKISDVAGLLVAPVVLAALLSVRSRRSWVAVHVVIGTVFAAIQLSASAAAGWDAVMGTIGLSWHTTPDLTDLAALPALLLSAWLFAKATEPRAGLTVLQHALLPVGVVFCVATAPNNDFRPLIDSGRFGRPFTDFPTEFTETDSDIDTDSDVDTDIDTDSDTDTDTDTGMDTGLPPFELLELLPPCQQGPSDGRIDLYQRCIDGACLGMTPNLVTGVLGASDGCSPSGPTVTCTWIGQGIDVEYGDTDANGLVGPAELAVAVHASLPFSGGTAGGLGIGTDTRCWVDLQGIPDDVVLTWADGGWHAPIMGWEAKPGSLWLEVQDFADNAGGPRLHDDLTDRVSLF